MRYQPFAEDIRALLFAATRDLHDQVDKSAGRYDLARPSGRSGFLQFMYRGLQPVEDGLDGAVAGRLYPAWHDRRRAAVLRGDIRRAGAGIPDTREPVPFANALEVWGGLYVLEGSRLGARLIARDWPDADLPGFLRPDPAGTWPKFLECIRRCCPEQIRHPQVVGGARKAFGAFLD
jgi:heme oxygenase